MVLGVAMQTYREALAEHQEVLMHLADMLIDVYSPRVRGSALRRRTVAARRRSMKRRPVSSSTTRRCASKRLDTGAGGHGAGRRSENNARGLQAVVQTDAHRHRHAAPAAGRRRSRQRRMDLLQLRPGHLGLSQTRRSSGGDGRCWQRRATTGRPIVLRRTQPACDGACGQGCRLPAEQRPHSG